MRAPPPTHVRGCTCPRKGHHITNLHNLCPVGLEALKCAKVHGGLGQDNVSGIQKHPGADVYALLGGCGDLHLGNRHSVPGSNSLTKFRNALRGAVLQRFGAIFFQNGGRQPGDLLSGEGHRCRVAASKGAYCRKVHLPENLPHRTSQKARNIVGKKLVIVHTNSSSDGDVPKTGTSHSKKAIFDGDVPKNGTSPSPGHIKRGLYARLKRLDGPRCPRSRGLSALCCLWWTYRGRSWPQAAWQYRHGYRG